VNYSSFVEYGKFFVEKMTVIVDIATAFSGKMTIFVIKTGR